MKRVGVLAKVQIGLGVVLAVYCMFFNVGGFRAQEISIGKNLVDYGRTIDDHRKLVKVSAENFFKINKSLFAVSNGCRIVAESVKHIPYVKVIAPPVRNLHDLLRDQCAAIAESEKTFPKTLKTLDDTSANLKKIGNLLQNESPVNKVCMHIRVIGLLLAVMMIVNGIAFSLIAKEK